MSKEAEMIKVSPRTARACLGLPLSETPLVLRPGSTRAGASHVYLPHDVVYPMQAFEPAELKGWAGCYVEYTTNDDGTPQIHRYGNVVVPAYFDDVLWLTLFGGGRDGIAVHRSPAPLAGGGASVTLARIGILLPAEDGDGFIIVPIKRIMELLAKGTVKDAPPGAWPCLYRQTRSPTSSSVYALQRLIYLRVDSADGDLAEFRTWACSEDDVVITDPTQTAAARQLFDFLKQNPTYTFDTTNDVTLAASCDDLNRKGCDEWIQTHPKCNGPWLQARKKGEGMQDVPKGVAEYGAKNGASYKVPAAAPLAAAAAGAAPLAAAAGAAPASATPAGPSKLLNTPVGGTVDKDVFDAVLNTANKKQREIDELQQQVVSLQAQLEARGAVSADDELQQQVASLQAQLEAAQQRPTAEAYAELEARLEAAQQHATAAENTAALQAKALRRAELSGSIEALIRAMDAGDVGVIRHNGQLDVIVLSSDAPEDVRVDMRWYMMQLTAPAGDFTGEDLDKACAWLANPTYVADRFTIPIDSAFSCVLFKRAPEDDILDINDTSPMQSPRKRVASTTATPVRTKKQKFVEQDDGESD